MESREGATDEDKAIVLAAGVGVRLQPLTTKTPKALLKVGPRPIVDGILPALAKNKVTEVCVVVGHQASVIMRYLSETFPYPEFNISCVYNPPYRNTNAAYSLWLVSSSFSDCDVFIENGDLLVVPEAVERMVRCRRTCLVRPIS